MKAAWYERQGSAREVIQYGEQPSQPLGEKEVRLRLAFSGLNPSDLKRRMGFNGQPHAFPLIIPNSDGAGTVLEIGAQVKDFRVGDRAWVFNAQWKRPFGTNAEEVVLPAHLVRPLPENVSLAYGACLGIPALTAHRALFADGSIAGKVILVHGGAGSVGNCAIQLARWAGATVISTVSSDEKAEAALKAGAEQVIHYKRDDVSEKILAVTDGQGVDRIVEVAFGENLPVTLKVLKAHGVISCYASDRQPTPALPFYPFMMKNLTLRWVFMYELLPQDLRTALSDINLWLSGAPPVGADPSLRAAPAAVYEHIDRTFSLHQTSEAHEYLESGMATGNVLIDVQ
jgi:NADPH2:quinone reductase